MLSSRGASSAAIKRLTIEYKQLSSDPNSLFPATGPIDESNYLVWEALVPGPEGTPFEGGVFTAKLTFRMYKNNNNNNNNRKGWVDVPITDITCFHSLIAPTYPLEPPVMKFEPPLFHPNVYPDGTVCISILHAAGDDPNSELILLEALQQMNKC